MNADDGMDEAGLRELEAELRGMPLRSQPPAEWRRAILPHLAAAGGGVAAATAVPLPVATASVVAVVPSAPLFSRPLAISLAAAWVLAAGLKIFTPPDEMRALPPVKLPADAAPAFRREMMGQDGDLLTMQSLYNR